MRLSHYDLVFDLNFFKSFDALFHCISLATNLKLALRFPNVFGAALTVSCKDDLSIILPERPIRRRQNDVVSIRCIPGFRARCKVICSDSPVR